MIAELLDLGSATITPPPPPPITPQLAASQTSATQLADLNHYWGSDLNYSNTGDLSTVSGVTRGQQRILRRLLTNPGSYYFQPTYGAGLPRNVGGTSDPQKIAALVQSQVLLEDSVAKTPAPVVSVVPAATKDSLAVTINYTDQPSNAPTALSFTLS